MKEVILNAGMIVIIIVGLLGISMVSAYQFIDTTQAKFERAQMVGFKLGGVGQVVKRSSKNTGLPWNLTPVFCYQVRREDGQKIWYAEWELIIKTKKDYAHAVR
jgi:hypothetical protein